MTVRMLCCCNLNKEEKISLLGDHSCGENHVRPGSEKETNTSEPHPIFPSYRLLVCTIAFLGACCSFGSQAIVGASLLLMIRPGDDVTANVTNLVTSTQTSNRIISTGSKSLYHEDEWHFAWDKSTKGWLTSSYFIGYFVMQVPTGLLMGRWGGYKLILMSGSVNVLCQALSVWVPRCGPVPFAGLLFVSGLANACSFPALFNVTAKWCPPNESSRLMSVVFAGVSIGNAIMYCISAGTSRIELMGGWPFNFIFMVGFQTTFLLLWAILVTNSPTENRFVQPSEVNYIQEYVSQKTYHSEKTYQPKRVPWRKILTSGPVYAIAATLYGADFLTYGMITIFPEYFVAVRHMKKTAVSMLAGLPWLACPLTSYLVSNVVDALRERQYLATITLRKICDVLAKPVPGVLLVLSSVLPEDYLVLPPVLYALSIVIMMAFQGCTWPANMAEIAPNYAAEVLVIGQLFSMTSPFIAPPVFAALTAHNRADEWQLCFGICLALCVVTSLIYLALASSQQQDWDDTPTRDSEGASDVSQTCSEE